MGRRVPGAHQGERITIAKLRWLLGKATAALGEVHLAELSPDQVSAWRLSVPEGHRFEATQALRQVLNRAVDWKLIDDNPAKRVPNPARRCREQRPFDSWQQIRSLAEQLGPTHGPMVLFAAATGLRPSELFALEQRDLDRAAGVVQIRRAYANGRVKHTKTRLSRRAVPLQRIALEALDHLQMQEDTPVLFPNADGGHLDFRNFNRRHWKPVQKAAGIDPLRDLYDLRHTYATFALRAGVPVFALSRFMGTSIAMIDSTTAISRPIATSTPSRSSTRSRSKGPWTLGGRRPGGPQSRAATRFPGRAEGVRGGWWTLGGRRRQKP